MGRCGENVEHTPSSHRRKVFSAKYNGVEHQVHCRRCAFRTDHSGSHGVRTAGPIQGPGTGPATGRHVSPGVLLPGSQFHMGRVGASVRSNRRRVESGWHPRGVPLLRTRRSRFI